MKICPDQVTFTLSNNTAIAGNARMFGFNRGTNAGPPVWNLFTAPPPGGFFLATVFNPFSSQIYVATIIAGNPHYVAYDLSGALILNQIATFPFGDYQLNTVAASGQYFFIKRGPGGWFRLDTFLLTEVIVATLPAGAAQNTTTLVPKVIQNDVYTVVGGVNIATTTITATGQIFQQSFPSSPSCFINDGESIYTTTLIGGIWKQTNTGNIVTVVSGTESGETIAIRYAEMPAKFCHLKIVASSFQQLIQTIKHWEFNNNAKADFNIYPAQHYPAFYKQNVVEIEFDEGIIADGDNFFTVDVLPGHFALFEFTGFRVKPYLA